MANAKDARQWARNALHGIGDSLYTPFSGRDGDDIDWDAYRTLVRHCVGTLRHPMLWVTSGVAEFWSLTIAERKKLLEVAIDEARGIDPDVIVQSCTAALSAKDCLELTQHAQDAGADIVYIQTPMMELHGGEGVLNFFKYIADRTDIALGMFNSPSSGYVLSAQEGARIVEEIPAVCATKEGSFRPHQSRLLHELAPDLVIWECDTTVYRAGWLKIGHRRPRAAGYHRLPLRDAEETRPVAVLGLGLERQAGRGNGLRAGVGARPVRARHAGLVHPLSRTARLLHPLGRCVQIRRIGDRAAGRLVPGIPPAAG